MSVSLSAERDRIQRQVEQLEQSLSATHAELELLSSETDDESDGDDAEEDRQSAAGLLAQREKIQNEIQNLEEVLGQHNPVCVSDNDDDSSSEESELALSPSADSCLQMNLVYQQVVQETLDQLETLLTHNQRQQKELVSQLSGPIKESSRERPAHPSYQQPINMYLGRFLKPYFKDKLTGLGPPANQETKEKASRMTGCLEDKKMKVKRWETWQKTLLIHSVTRDSLRRLIQPKLSKVDYLSQKLSRAAETDKQQLRQQMDSLERDIELFRAKKENELVGDRFDEHDWQKISNIDFEGTREAEDLRSFWQNFLHPSISKLKWSKEEVHQLKEISRTHGERHWETIAAELGTGRTAFLCLQTFQRFVSDSLKHGGWTPDEDALLRELVDKMRIGNFIPYTQMSYFMEGRDPAQLIYRWNQVLDPSLKKGFWTKEEDRLLLHAVSRFGEKDWWKIRFEVPGRTDSGCRDRYYDCLKAETKRGPFDQQEKQLLLLLVEKHGVGRWAKIAAEIPLRYDAQCLREWRKLSKPALPPRPEKGKTTRKRSGGRQKKKKKKQTPPAKKRVKRLMVILKEEENSEEEEMVVEYMDSDEEEKTKTKEEGVEVESLEEEEEEYIFPPMQEWIPAEKAQWFTFLSFRPVELPSSRVAHNQVPVRSTILGQFGRSVILGPAPRELRWAERHGSSTLMMVSPDQLRAHLHRQAEKFSNRISGPPRKIQTDKQNPLGRWTDPALCYELQAAVTPWIGNVLIPQKNRATAADALRERGETAGLLSTPVFLLLLQTMNVDTVGCKEMIEQRKNSVVVLAPPAPCPTSFNPNTVAGMLQQKRAIKEEQKKQKLLLLQRPPPPPRQNRPGILLQMPPNKHPWMSSVSFPQAVFIPHPVMNTSPPAPHRPPPVGVLTSLLPAHPAPHSVPLNSVVPVTLNATSSTCSAAFRQQPVPLTQTLMVALPQSPDQRGSVGSTPHSQHLVPSGRPTKSGSAPSPLSLISSSPKERRQKVAEDQSGVVMGGTDNGVGGAYSIVGGAYTRVGGAGVSVFRETEEGRRIRKPSPKAKALQEATEAKAGEKKKAASSPQKRTQIQTAFPVPPQQVCSTPIQLVPQTPPSSVTTLPTAPREPPPAEVNLSALSLAPPPSIPTYRHLASSNSSLLAPFLHDHDYTFLNLGPRPTPDSTPNELPKAPPSRRKRGKWEEQPSVSSSQEDQCVGGTGEAVGGAGVIQKGKRVRNPSQRARAQQEATQAKAEAKKKRTSSSSPRNKRSCTSCPKEEVVKQNQPMPQLPGFCLLPGQSMWVMTPGGLVQLAQAPPQGLQLTLVPTVPLPAPPWTILTSQLVRPPTAVSVPEHPPVLNQLRPLTSMPILQPVSNPPPQPPPKLFMPYKGTVRVDPAAPPPLQFDPSLMFLESQEAVRDWLSGRGGVAVPGTSVALPYLPPFVSSLNTISALLRAKKALTKSSLKLLCRGSEPQRYPTKPRPDSSSETLSSQPPDLPDSTSELGPPQDSPASSISPDLQEEEEAELVVVIRQLVGERFSGNPAYQLLKARFLSCFTVPALLATMQPIREKGVTGAANEEEEEEEREEEQLKKMEERARQRRAERSLLLCDGSGAAANHFSGITSATPAASVST
ncbi:snRNA-activating protein complex subunit 4 isoform X2 [Cebidichthys violaceus]|uniref:snRNA-activating protein complex subunit 4 isoform X2 n=1 Tax=Cebidichthys violaceus TaxID=271503 RepID=UPI0035CB1B24